MKDIHNFDIIIVGAGVIGIAIAKACAQKKKSVLLIEKSPQFGEGISSRNSEVIHAGIYYPENSLKPSGALFAGIAAADTARKEILL